VHSYTMPKKDETACEWRKVHNDKFQNLSCWTRFVNMNKTKSMRCAHWRSIKYIERPMTLRPLNTNNINVHHIKRYDRVKWNEISALHCTVVRCSNLWNYYCPESTGFRPVFRTSKVALWHSVGGIDGYLPFHQRYATMICGNLLIYCTRHNKHPCAAGSNVASTEKSLGCVVHTR